MQPCGLAGPEPERPAGNLAPPEVQAPGLCGEVGLVVTAASLKASPREKRTGDERRPAQARAPRSTQGQCSVCCHLPADRTPTLGSSSVPPAGRELFLLGASLLPRQTPGFLLSTNANSPSSSCLPERLKGSDSFRPFSPQCDISDFSLLSVPGKVGLPYPQSPGAGVVFTQLNSSLHRFRRLE